MIFSCIGHQEIDFMKFVKYLWSFIEDCAKFGHIFFSSALFFEDCQGCISLNF